MTKTMYKTLRELPYMDAIYCALQEVYFNIPMEALIAIFEPITKNKTLDQCIREEVIEWKVLTDLNIVGGKFHKILLDPSFAEYCPTPYPYNTLNGGGYGLYRIPPEAREYRDIVNVIGIDYPYQYSSINASMDNVGFASSASNYGATMSNLAGATLNSQTYSSNLVKPTPQLLNGNMIKLAPCQNINNTWLLKCRLGWDRNFTSMENNSIKIFCDLVHYAVRVYIYVKGTVQSNKTYVSMGQEIVSMREIIAKGEDYVTKYNETLQMFIGTNTMSTEDRIELIRLMM